MQRDNKIYSCSLAETQKHTHDEQQRKHLRHRQRLDMECIACVCGGACGLSNSRVYADYECALLLTKHQIESEPRIVPTH